MIKFTQIPERLHYPKQVSGKISTLHSVVVMYVSNNFKNTAKYRNKVLTAMNILSYVVMNKDSMPESWDETDPLKNLPDVDDSACRKLLKDIYLLDKNVDWDIDETDEVDTPKESDKVNKKPEQKKPDISRNTTIDDKETPKEYLYIKPPVVPQFDYSRPWKQYNLGGETYTIYTSLPEVPTKQNEISVTTDVSKFTDRDLMNLYPNHFVRTRAAIMYDEIPGVPFDEKLGVIIPIEGFTTEQVKDNIVKYPHLFRLSKEIGGVKDSFYKTIEIDGILQPVAEVWDSLKVSKILPRNSEFIKEYAVRLYLMERDILGKKHNFELCGSLMPFLTLFTTPDDYIQMGYTDVVDMARQCVIARVSYKQTRNPIMRRAENV